MKNKYIPLYYDLPFKNLFGTEKNIKYTTDMLEKLFNLEKGSLDGSVIENSVVLDKKTIEEKRFELDIVLKVPSGNIINIEMQKLYDKNAEIKNFMYVTSLFSTELMSGEEYKKIRGITQVNFVKNNKLHKDNEIIKKYCMMNMNNPKDLILGNIFNVIIVDVDGNVEYNKNEEGFASWLGIIRAETIEEATLYAGNDPILKGAIEEMERFANNKYVEDYSRQELLIKSQLASMEEEGREEGRAEGREEGRKEGQKQEKIEIAKKLLMRETSLNEIAELTGLAVEEIELLK